MAWTVEISDVAERQLRKLDRSVKKRILDWLDDRIEGVQEPPALWRTIEGRPGRILAISNR